MEFVCRYFVLEQYAWKRLTRAEAKKVEGIKLDKESAEKIIEILGAGYMATHNYPLVREAAHYVADALHDAVGIQKQ